MSTYTQILYQLVFSTKYRHDTLPSSQHEKLYAYMSGVLKKKNCFCYIINGVENHIHILTHIHPAVSISNIVKDIKLASSAWIKESGNFPDFIGWQRGYGAFTYSINAKDAVFRYIKNQKQHHAKKNFKDEYVALLKSHQVDYDEQYVP